MLESTSWNQRLSAVGRIRHCRGRPLLVIALAHAVGCSHAHYRAATLPEQFRVPKSQAHEINLASMSGFNTGSSRIGPGDLVEIIIASGGEEEKTEPVQARVARDGTVNVPMIGDVAVAGIEPVEAADRIASASVERGIYRQPAVVLKVVEPAVNRVTVLGAVAEPGTQELPRGASDVLSAIAAAAGFTEDASTEVDVMRQDSPSFFSLAPGSTGVTTASYSEPVSPPRSDSESRLPGGSPTKSAELQTVRLDLAQANPSRPADYRVGDGDVVMVLPEKERVIHVLGLVNRPDRFKLPKDQDVHVLDAIAMAGGIKSPVADKVLVIRRLENMPEPAVIQVSIAKAKKDGRENLRLTEGDMVSVESTMLTHTVDTLTTFFRMSLGIGGNFATF